MIDTKSLLEDLVSRTEAARERVLQDPFGNPVLDMVLAVSRLMDEGTLDSERIDALIHALRDDAYGKRALRLSRYVGGTDVEQSCAAMASLSERLATSSLEEFRANVEALRFTAVFTAHPTFSLPPEVARDLARLASGGTVSHPHESHRPKKPTLADELEQATAAIKAGRDAIDTLTVSMLEAAKSHWPDAWSRLAPKPVALASWVGYDTDGRTDIAWWDTFRIRLGMKALQLSRLAAQIEPVSTAGELSARLRQAISAVDAQYAACPVGDSVDPAAVAALAQSLVAGHDNALVSGKPLLPLFEAAIAAADESGAMTLCVARAGLLSHGLSLSHTQFRLNATQLHNTLRQQIGLDDAVGDASQRRAMLAAINTALDEVTPTPVDFGALLAETSSATQLMMTVAQIAKHVDGDTRIRFHIAETETGYTVLVRAMARKVLRHRGSRRDQPAVRDRRGPRAGRARAG